MKMSDQYKDEHICILSTKMAAHLILKNNILASRPKKNLKDESKIVFFFVWTPKLEQDMASYNLHKDDLYKSYDI